MFTAKENAFNPTSCFACVGDTMEKCIHCSNSLMKYGKTKSGKQRFYCRNCKVSKVNDLTKPDYGDQFNEQIIQFTKEGLGIRSTARILKIAPSTVIRKILRITGSIPKPEIPFGLKCIQVDELHTYLHNKNKGICVIYS